jgi:hypothetical protein
MNVSELTGALLDYWVARANGWTFGPPHKVHEWDVWRDGSGEIVGTIPAQSYTPSTDWAQGGPIIEREQGAFQTYHGLLGYPADRIVSASMGRELMRYQMDGPTHLVAAMRAYVASKFGAEVADET